MVNQRFEQDTFRPKEEAARLRCSPATIWRLVACGALRAKKISKRVTVISGGLELLEYGIEAWCQPRPHTHVAGTSEAKPHT